MAFAGLSLEEVKWAVAVATGTAEMAGGGPAVGTRTCGMPGAQDVMRKIPRRTIQRDVGFDITMPQYHNSTFSPVSFYANVGNISRLFQDFPCVPGSQIDRTPYFSSA